MTAIEQLDVKVEELEAKADKYQTATNFEAKKQEYLSGLSSIESSLSQLEQRVEKMEFLATVLIDVLEVSNSAPGSVVDARQSVESHIGHDADYYYELVDENNTDQYEQKLQQARSNVQTAIDELKAKLREVEREWKDRVGAARNVQKLFGQSQDISKTFSDIENFVDRRMWDDSESVQTLAGEWQGLMKSWERSGVDWETFKEDYGLSNETVEILKELAKGSNVTLDELDEDVAMELLGVEELRSVVKLTV